MKLQVRTWDSLATRESLRAYRLSHRPEYNIILQNQCLVARLYMEKWKTCLPIITHSDSFPKNPALLARTSLDHLIQVGGEYKYTISFC